MAVDVSRLAVGLDTALRSIAMAEGRRDALAARLAETERAVGLAKGRLALKGRVEAFVEQLQDAASRRVVGSYETLLNALVDEVFPDQRPEKRRVVLDLGVERGLPSLDVLVESDQHKDEREDVLEDNGGALTNVISMGLRLVAAVKSHTARFLLLDEADCWVEPSRVGPFYEVLRNAADRLDVQCLAISHHDVAKFGSGIHTARLHGMPKKGGVHIVGDGQPPEWPDDRVGFRYIRLVSVQGYVDETVPLAPGVTAIGGPNGLGKSTITRAWRAVFYGEGRNSLIRHGSKQATVDLGYAGGRFLRYTRARNRNPVNQWSLHEADGSVVDEGGVRYESLGKTQPEWVSDMFGIRPVEGLNVHVSHQKYPIFLLGETAAKRASVLSIGQEASHIQTMQTIFRERCTRDQATVREGEKNVGETRAALAAMEGLSALAEDAGRAKAAAEAIGARERSISAHASHAAAVEGAAANLARARAKAAACAAVPPPHTAADLERSLRESAGVDAVASRLEAAARGLARAVETRDLMAALPADSPAVLPTEHMLKFGTDVKKASDALGRARRAREILGDLPAVPATGETDQAEALGQAVATAASRLAVASGRAVALAALPARPALRPTDPDAAAADRLDQAARGLAEAGKKAAAAADKLADVKRRTGALLAKTGGLCMTCGQAVGDSSMLLEGHGH